MVSRSAAARVLLVSDDPRWRQACYRRFPISMETAWVSLLDSALAELDVQSFDVVVVDTSLPDAAPDRNLPILERMARRLPVIAVVHDDLIHAWALERRERVSLLRVPPEAGIEQQASMIAGLVAEQLHPTVRHAPRTERHHFMSKTVKG